MFDIGWSEILVIGVVLIVVVGPKDLPRMLRTFGRTTTQLRKMAGDFRKQFDEALREAEMDDVRTTVNDLRSLNPASDIRKAMNPMRAVGEEIRSSLMAATRAPEPTVPSATAPAAPVDPTPADPAPVHPAMSATAEAQAHVESVAPPPPPVPAPMPSEVLPPVDAPSATPAIVLNGAGVHDARREGADARREGETT